MTAPLPLPPLTDAELDEIGDNPPVMGGWPAGRLLADDRWHRAELAMARARIVEISETSEKAGEIAFGLIATERHLRELAEAEIERLRDHLTWVLPLAKGYAAAHPVGRNAEIVANAEAALAPEGKERT